MTEQATPPTPSPDPGPLRTRAATTADAAHLAALVRTAYRGTAGWTTESALLDDQRIDVAGVTSKITDPATSVIVVEDDASGAIVACCEVVDHAERSPGVAYFGMFAVDPAHQAAGLGRTLLASAESYAARELKATTMEMTVIGQREELIAYYVRRGYVLTEETRPFPFEQMVGGGALRDDLYFAVLRKTLGQGDGHRDGQGDVTLSTAAR